MNGFKYFLSFALGLAGGIAISWKYLKNKYEAIAQERVEAANNFIYQLEKDHGLGEKENISKESKEARKPFETYTTLSSQYKSAEKKMKYSDKFKSQQESNVITLIDSSELGKIPNYDVLRYTYYKDDILADEREIEIPEEDREEDLGHIWEQYFDEINSNVVCVRNHKLKTDYEITRTDERYSNVLDAKPYLKRKEE